LVQLERTRDVRAHPAAGPAVEGARADHHHHEVLRVRDLGAVLVLETEHRRHRRGIGPPEADAAAIVCVVRRHGTSVAPGAGGAWAILAVRSAAPGCE